MEIEGRVAVERREIERKSGGAVGSGGQIEPSERRRFQVPRALLLLLPQRH